MLNVTVMEMQIKTTMRHMNHTFTPMKMVIIKKKRSRIANIGKDLKKLETSYIVYGMRK